MRIPFRSDVSIHRQDPICYDSQILVKGELVGEMSIHIRIESPKESQKLSTHIHQEPTQMDSTRRITKWRMIITIHLRLLGAKVIRVKVVGQLGAMRQSPLCIFDHLTFRITKNDRSLKCGHQEAGKKCKSSNLLHLSPLRFSLKG